jgi:hypothetical protein
MRHPLVQSRADRARVPTAVPSCEILEDRRLLAAIGGFVYLDRDNDGVKDAGEPGISNVVVTLTGRTTAGVNITQTARTDANGFYGFFKLPAGTYNLKETQPAGYDDGKDTPGVIRPASVSNDFFCGIVLRAEDCPTNYNFGERPKVAPTPPPPPPPPPTPPPPAPTPPPPAVGVGSTATIGFWHNKNGQKLLTSLNGGPSAKNLGNWLATNFPRLWGAQAGANNLAGKTNAQVAAFFLQVFSAKGGPKTEAQALGLAFAVYVTDSDLAGTVARSFGFTVGSVGTGGARVNVGSAGTALGVANGSTLSVMQILQAVNAKATNGMIYPNNKTFRSQVNDLLSKINETFDRK